MMKWTVLSITFLLLSCQTKIESNSKQYFDFDNIEYYYNDFDRKKLLELSKNESNSELDSIKFGVIVGEVPNELTDTTFVDKLERIGYSKKSIKKSKFEEISNMFSEKVVTESNAYACAPIYRDVFVFKRKNKIIGTAKVCFDCRIHKITGTSLNTVDFGQNGDYERLFKLIRD